jgi:hypothetical protein
MTKLIALLALSPLALAACGSSNDPAAKGPDDSDASRVTFEQCLRDHGVQVESAPGGGGGVATKITVRGGRGPSPQKFQQTQRDCMKKAGFKPKAPSAEDQAKFRDAALKFARCMRAHGIDMPDPQVAGDGMGMLQKGPTGVNPNAPRFQEAQKECGKLMPGGGPKTSGGAGVSVSP